MENEKVKQQDSGLPSRLLNCSTAVVDRSAERVKCKKCGRLGDKHFVSYTSKYGAGIICQKCDDEETIYHR